MFDSFQLSFKNFRVKSPVDQIEDAIDQARDTVTHSDKKPVKVIVDSLSRDKVKPKIIYWFDPAFKGLRSEARTQVWMKVLDVLKEKGIKFSG